MLRALLLLVFLSSLLPAFSQSAFQRWQAIAGHVPLRQVYSAVVADRDGPTCTPDTVARYIYPSPTDSILVSLQVRLYYGVEAYVKYNYSDSSSTPSYRDSTVYDALGRTILDEESSFSTDSNQLITTLRVLSFPHGNTQSTDSLIVFMTDFQTGVFGPFFRTVSIFDANDRVQEEDQYLYQNNAWVLHARTLSTYTPTGQLASSQDENWNGSSWTPNGIREFFYNANDTLVLQTGTSLPAGVTSFKAEFTYDPIAHSKTIAQFTLVDSVWVPQVTFLDDFDAEGRYERSQVTYEGGGNRDDYHYANGCLWFIEETTTVDGENWLLSARAYYYDQDVVATGEPAAGKQWMAYPNPAGDDLWLEAPTGSPVRMTDLQGRNLYMGSAQGKERIDLSRFPTVFFVTIGEGRLATTRIISRSR